MKEAMNAIAATAAVLGIPWLCYRTMAGALAPPKAQHRHWFVAALPHCAYCDQPKPVGR